MKHPSASPPPASCKLKIEGLGYSYGVKRALSDISFSIDKGEFKMLLGPNGAGKTTLFSLITRLYQSAEGSIYVNGIDLNDRPGPALASMGVVFQQPTLDLDLSVEQNLLYHTALHGIGRGQAKMRIEEELERMNMVDRRKDTVRSLNGGHRRRVEIARSLLHSPKILLLDEPTVGLDVPTRRSIVEHVHSLCQSHDLAVMWATHLIDEIFHTDHVVILHEGTIRAQGSVEEVNACAGADTMDVSFNLLTTGNNTGSDTPVEGFR